MSLFVSIIGTAPDDLRSEQRQGRNGESQVARGQIEGH